MPRDLYTVPSALMIGQVKDDTLTIEFKQGAGILRHVPEGYDILRTRAVVELHDLSVVVDEASPTVPRWIHFSALLRGIANDNTCVAGFTGHARESRTC